MSGRLWVFQSAALWLMLAMLFGVAGASDVSTPSSEHLVALDRDATASTEQALRDAGICDHRDACAEEGSDSEEEDDDPLGDALGRSALGSMDLLACRAHVVARMRLGRLNRAHSARAPPSA